LINNWQINNMPDRGIPAFQPQGNEMFISLRQEILAIFDKIFIL